MKVCITKENIVKFRKSLKDKELNIIDLMKMSSEDRTALFAKFAGENAKDVNLLFEQKLILKNKMIGLKNWASKVGEFGRYDLAKKEEIANKISEYRAQQQERIFSPKEDEAFLADLAESKLGVSVTEQEAKNIFEMTSKIEELRKGYSDKTETWKDEKTRIEYGSTKVALDNYMNELKGIDKPFIGVVKEKIGEIKTTFGTNKQKAIYNIIKDSVNTIAENSISLVASVDNSFLGRQGIKTLYAHPSAWLDGAKNSFKDIWNTLGGKETMDALTADMYSRPNYLNGEYQKAGIIAKTEEQFPATLPEKIPVLGRVFKASEAAFKGSGLRMRTDLYDIITEKAKGNGVEMTDTQIKDIGKVVNSLTARGQWGQRGEAPVVRLVLWAPKMLKANIDVLTAHAGGAGLETPFARQEARNNIMKIIGTIALILGIARAVKKDSVEFDPRSANFGKIKIGDTRFDLTGGASSLVTLASRLATNSTKSSTTGLVRPFGTGYGQSTRFDVFIDFLSGKTTPFPAGVLVDLMKGRTWEGDKPTFWNEIYRKGTPIPIQEFIDLKDNASADRILGAILNVGGVSTSSYSASDVDWGQSTGKELMQFKEKVGEDKFKEANNLFNKQISDWLVKIKDNNEYKKLTEEEKAKVQTTKKDEFKDEIFKKYNFKYKKEETKKLPKF